jgi:hypothetical protein
LTAIQPEVGTDTLYDGDGAAPASADTAGAQRPRVPTKHRVDEHSADTAEKLAVVGQARSELEGYREHQLSERDVFGQDVVDEVGRALRHQPYGMMRADTTFAR